MGLELKEVEERLTLLKDITSRAEQLSPDTPLDLDTFKLQFRVLNTNLPYLAANPEPLFKLENYTFNFIKKHLQGIAQAHNIPWKVDALDSKESIPKLASLVSDFEKELTLKKQDASKKLNTMRKRTKVKRRQAIIEEAEAKRSDVLVIGEEEKNIPPTLLEEIKELKKTFDEFARFFSKEKEKERTFDEGKNDIQISRWSRFYNIELEEALVLINHITNEYKRMVNFSGYYDDLKKELCLANKNLQTHKENTERYLDSIKEKQKDFLSSDEESIQALQKRLSKERESLIETLDKFFNDLTAIDFGSIEDPYTKSSIPTLKNTIDDLEKSLLHYSNCFEKEAVKEIKKLFLRYLPEEKELTAEAGNLKKFATWYESTVSIFRSKKSEEDTIVNRKLWHNHFFNILNEEHAEKAELLQKIHACLDISSRIKNSSLEAIKKYHDLKKITTQEEQSINDTYDTIKKQISDALVALINKKNLLPKESVDASLSTAKKMIDQLERFLSILEDTFLSYKKEINNDKFSEEPISKLKLLLSIQVKFREPFENLAKEKEQLMQETIKCQKELDHQFPRERKALKNALEEALTHAKAAALIRFGEYYSNNDNDSKAKIDIQLATCQKILKEEIPRFIGTWDLNTQKERDEKTPESESSWNLNNLKKIVDLAIEELKSIEIKCKNDLHLNIFKPKFDEIQAQKFALATKDPFNELNPFLQELANAYNKVNKKFTRFSTHFKTFDDTPGDRLKEWSVDFYKTGKDVNQSLDRYTIAQKNAQEIERRLKTKAYKTSQTILESLEHEFSTIFDEQFAKLSSEMQEKMPRLTIFDVPTEEDRVWLNTLDPRLTKLCDIFQDFTAINNKYINEDLYCFNRSKIALKPSDKNFQPEANTFYFKLLRDGSLEYTVLLKDRIQVEQIDQDFLKKYSLENPLTLEQLEPIKPLIWEKTAEFGHKPSEDSEYLDSLKENVYTHLRNDNMENLSDGIRHPFIQWIRINILKPLQALTPSKDAQAPDRFFIPITYGACETERNLINLGNSVCTALENIPRH